MVFADEMDISHVFYLYIIVYFKRLNNQIQLQ